MSSDPIEVGDGPFSDSSAKIARARKHLAELQALTDGHFEDHPTQVHFQSNIGPNGEKQQARLKVQVAAAPSEFGAIVGDAVHNLRAALDLMAVSLVRLRGENSNGVYFPFSGSEEEFPAMIRRRNFHRAGSEAVRVLEGLRPYPEGNVALRALHDLDIQDKHHRLIPSSALIETPKVTAELIDGTLEGGVRLRLVEDSSPRVLLVFPEGAALANQEVIPTLYELVVAVEGILESFAKFAGEPSQTR